MKNLSLFAAFQLLLFVSALGQIKNFQYTSHISLFENINLKSIDLDYDRATIGNNCIFIPNKKSFSRSDMVFSIDNSTMKRKGYYIFSHEKVFYRILDIAFDSTSNKLFALYVEKVKSGDLIVSLYAFTESLELISKRTISILNNFGNKAYLFAKNNSLLVVYPEADDKNYAQVRYEVYDYDLNKKQSNLINIPLKTNGREILTPDFDFLSKSLDNEGNFFSIINAITDDKRNFQRSFPVIIKFNIISNQTKLINLSSKIENYSLNAMYMTKINDGKSKIIGIANEIGTNGKILTNSRLFLIKLDLENENIDFFNVYKINKTQIDKSPELTPSYFIDIESQTEEAFFNNYIIEEIECNADKLIYFNYWQISESGDRIIMTSLDKNGLFSLVSINDTKIEHIKLFSTYNKKASFFNTVKLSNLIIENKIYAFNLIRYDVNKFTFENKEINEYNVLQSLKYLLVDLNTGEITAKADYFKDVNGNPMSINFDNFPNNICFNPTEKSIYIYLMAMKQNLTKLIPATSKKKHAINDSYFSKISF